MDIDYGRAIAIYLQHAYPNGGIPANRRHFQELKPDVTLDDLAKMIGAEPLENGVGVNLRLGCPWYPNLKLRIHRTPSDGVVLFMVDTHDQWDLNQIPESEREEFKKLREKNQNLAREIESAWTAYNVPTQESLVRAWLASRPPRSKPEA